MKPLFAAGDCIQLEKEQITIKKAYPRGHQYAHPENFGYLIHSTDCGEDNWLEPVLINIVNKPEAKILKHKAKHWKPLKIK